jgi:hypothetical protein
VSIPPGYDNEHAARRRTAKAYRISRAALGAATFMMENEEWRFSRAKALMALRCATREERDLLRREAKVKPPSDGSLGVTDETWALVLELVARDL